MDNGLRRALARARDGRALDVDEATVLLAARGDALDELVAHAGRVRDAGGPGRRRHVLAQGLRPADPAVPRPLPLLHLRDDAGPAARAVPEPGRGAADRPGRRGAGLQGGAVHPGRPPGGALAPGPRVARRGRLRQHPGVRARLRGGGARGDRPAAPPQPRGHELERAAAAQAGGAVDGDDARDDGRRAGAPGVARTRSRPCGCAPWRTPGGCRCRSPRACWSASARPCATAPRPSSPSGPATPGTATCRR